MDKLLNVVIKLKEKDREFILKELDKFSWDKSLKNNGDKG